MSTRSAVAILLLVTVLVAGCGRRGPLESPAGPEAGVTTDSAARPGATPPAADRASPGATEPAEAAPGPAAPDRPFVLDPLI